MAKRIIATENAPAAVGAYVQAWECDGTLYVSGQLPLITGTKDMPVSVADQTKEALKNLFAIVKAAGYAKEDIVKCMCLLENISDFGEFNTAYGEMMGDHKPARAAFGGNQLPLGAKVEIDAVVVK